MSVAQVEFRFARDEEIPDIARLVSHSFPGAARPLPWWVEQLRDPVYGGGAETLWTGFIGTQPVAALQLHRLTQWIGGAPLRVAGVGTVAMSPVQRRRGLAGQLMVEALRAAHARGDAASALYPFRSQFYGRLGYGAAGEAQQWVVAPQSLAEAPERDGMHLLETVHEREEALALYNGWIRTQSGQLERDARRWHRIATVQERALAGWRDAHGALQGYALVTYRTDLPVAERFLEVDELVWSTAAARRGLHAWLGSLGDQWSRIMIRALPSQRLGDWLAEPRLPRGSAPNWSLWEPAATLMMGPMFRILDMGRCWTMRPVHYSGPESFTLRVRDAQLPENDGAWRMTFGGGTLHPERCDVGEADFACDIAVLSRLFIGALSARAAVDAGLLGCESAALISRLDFMLTVPEPWTFDRF